MNQLIVSNQVTMTSIEIVEYINEFRKGNSYEDKIPAILRHDNFMKKVPEVLGESAPKFLGVASFSNGTGGSVERKIYRFPKREACLMAMSYSYELQARVFDHMTELENKESSRLSVPQTYAEALLEAGRLALEVEKRDEQLKLAAPKVEFVDKYVERSSLQTATQVAATFGMSAVKMNKTLDEIGGVYDKRIKRSRAFCADWIAKGYGETKQNEQGYSSSLFTPAGIMRVTEIFTSEGVI